MSFPYAEKKKNNLGNSKIAASNRCQDSDIPFKAIKENAAIFAEYILSGFGNSLTQSKFSLVLQLTDISSIFQVKQNISKIY